VSVDAILVLEAERLTGNHVQCPRHYLGFEEDVIEWMHPHWVLWIQFNNLKLPWAALFKFVEDRSNNIGIYFIAHKANLGFITHDVISYFSIF
jgi:hypothetical protein